MLNATTKATKRITQRAIRIVWTEFAFPSWWSGNDVGSDVLVANSNLADQYVSVVVWSDIGIAVTVMRDVAAGVVAEEVVVVIVDVGKKPIVGMNEAKNDVETWNQNRSKLKYSRCHKSELTKFSLDVKYSNFRVLFIDHVGLLIKKIN